MLVPQPTTPRDIVLALSAAVATYLLQKIGLLPFIALAPTVLSCTIVAITVAIVIVLLRHDHRSPPLSLASRQKSALPALAFATPTAWRKAVALSETENASPQESPSTLVTVHGLDSSTVKATLNSILTLINGSFILPWFTRISPSPAFPQSVETLIRTALSGVSQRAETIDWPALVTGRILPLVTRHVQYYRSIEHLASSSTASSVLLLPLPKDSHPALNHHLHVTPEANIPHIEAHLRIIVERVLDGVLSDQDKSAVAGTIGREVLLCAVLMPVFNMLCDSDFWNRQIDEHGSKILHERKQVNKVLSALSTVPPSASPASKSGARRPTDYGSQAASITVQSTTREFDDFMRSIPKLKTLGEARRLRADVDREMRSARLGYKAARRESQEGDGGKAVRRAARYIHRLDRAKTHIDRRIVSLSGASGSSPRASALPYLASPGGVKVSANLYTILSDPSSLAYWLEFMERRGHSHLVQFWLTVEGFKDPLEALGQDLPLNNSQEDSSEPNPNDDSFADDIGFLYATYFSQPTHRLSVPDRVVVVIEELGRLSVRPFPANDIRRGRQAVHEAQRAVYEQMEEEDWPLFQKSELYRKAVTDLKNPVAPATLAPSPTGPVRPRSTSPSLLSPEFHAPSSQRRVSDTSSPTLPRRPVLVNGSFSPASAATSSVATVVIAPSFEQPVARKITPPHGGSNPLSPTSATTPFITTTPPRRSTKYDLLFGAENETVSNERVPLFDEDEDEDEEALLETRRMQAIQAALDEIIDADDQNSTHHRHETPTPPLLMSPSGADEADVDPLSASAILMGASERHPLAHSKVASRSVEDLKSPSKVEIPSVRRRSSQFDTSGRKPRVYRRSSADGDLKGHRSSKSIFADDPLEEEQSVDGSGDPDELPHDEVHLAVPGDLHLQGPIYRLASMIQELTDQDNILSSLIRQAELTGNQKELRLLHKSQSSLRRELRTASFQKAQYEEQERENRLVPGRTRVFIPSTVVTPDDQDSSRMIVRYSVEVRQVGEEGNTELSWTTPHRYNEFWELDRAIHEWVSGSSDALLHRDAKAKMAELPGKRLVPSISANFVEHRRVGLEKYLQSLVTSAPLCNSDILRNFLSKSTSESGPDPSASTGSLSNLVPQKIVRSLYKTVGKSIDDAFGPSMLDLTAQSLGRQLSGVAGDLPDLAGFLPATLRAGVAGVTGSAPWNRPEARQSISSVSLPTGTEAMAAQIPEGMQPLEGESAAGSFTAPICDLFIEVFDLKENNWLRRQAIVILLQQVLGGTIERKVRDAFRHSTSDERINRVLLGFQNIMWPGGVRPPPKTPRDSAMKLETRTRASRRLGALMPDIAANMIGRGNARRAADRVFGVLQDHRLNQQLMLCVFDEIFGALFPPPTNASPSRGPICADQRTERVAATTPLYNTLAR